MDFSDFVAGKSSPQDSYIGWLLMSAVYMKSAHLETKSYARHKAYDFYYDGISSLTDTFSEQWLGFSGRGYVASLPAVKEFPNDTLKFLDLIIKKTEGMYTKCPRALHTVLDDVQGLALQTKYLLSLE